MVIAGPALGGDGARPDDVGGPDDVQPAVERQPEDDNVEWLIEESQDPPYDPLLGEFGRPLFQSIRGAKQHLEDAYRLDISLEYTLIYQVASGGVMPRDTAVGTFNLSGFQELGPEQDGPDRMGVGFALEHRANYESDGPAFTAGVGSVWSPNDASSDAFDEVKQVWWGQRFADGRLAYVVGKIDPGAYLNGNRYATSGNTMFFAQPFNTNPGRVFPANGLGAFAEVKPDDVFYFRFGFSDGSVMSSNPFPTFDDGDWFVGAESGMKVEVPGLGEGQYRVTYYRIDNGVGDADGIALSFDQDVASWLGVFLRFNHNDGDPGVGAIDNLLAVGVSFIEPLGRAGDSAGIGVGYTDPAGLDDQYNGEVYYRVELADGVDLSASAQLIVDPAANPGSDAVGVFGLRLHLLY